MGDKIYTIHFNSGNSLVVERKVFNIVAKQLGADNDTCITIYESKKSKCPHMIIRLSDISFMA